MNYKQTIDYLYNRLPMFSKAGSNAIKHGLYNIIKLCEILDNPQHNFLTIHIAGTNGKGSVSHMLASVMQTAGYKTGLYTSPHLVDFRERIKINGEMIPEKNVVQFVEKVEPFFDTITPSFFEITVAMAFDYFRNEKVDIAIIETGLGGRLDSTNIINPVLSVVTNIAYDHMDLLGNTLEMIASEKAGIIKRDIPVVIGQRSSDTDYVFIDKALTENASIVFAEDEWRYINHHSENRLLQIQLQQVSTVEKYIYSLDLRGSYQIHNLITVLSAINQLRLIGWNISDDSLSNGLSNTTSFTGLKGRWDIVSTQPLMVIDVGHNAHGISEVVKQIKQTPHVNLHIVIGMVKDKDINSVLKLLPQHAIYYFTKAQIPRALNVEELRDKALLYNLNGTAYSTVDFALTVAMESANKDDLIVICGSVFIAGEAYNFLKGINL